jgi:hypothetical protein
MIWLADDRELKVIYDELLSWEVVEQWTPGRKMTLAYSAAKGCVLIDVATGHQLPVIAGWHDDHPLDLLLKEDLSSADTTVDMVDAYVGSGDRWEIEIQRLYFLLIGMDVVPDETKNALEAARASWTVFRDTHLKAAVGLHLLPDGTRWQINHAEHYHRLVRDQALRLLALVDPPVAAQHIASWSEL